MFCRVITKYKGTVEDHPGVTKLLLSELPSFGWDKGDPPKKFCVLRSNFLDYTH